MLTDILGIAVGFVTVILFLSMIASGVVQMVNRQLRSLALWSAMRDLVQVLFHEEDAAWKRAKALLSTGLFRFENRWLPGRTEIHLEEIVEALDEVVGRRAVAREKETEEERTKREAENARHAAKLEQIKSRLSQRLFEQMEILSSVRFRKWAYVLSFGLGLALAAVFQISALDLWKRLVTDADWRREVIAAGEEIAVDDELGGSIERLGNSRRRNSPSEPSEDAEAASTDAEVASDTDTEVASDDERADLAEAAKDRLAGLDFVPFQEGRDFYKDPNHWFGLLLTAFLVAFGAPFWFDTLKKLVSVRDLFSDARKKQPAGSESE
jgi:hypothetical protein